MRYLNSFLVMVMLLMSCNHFHTKLIIKGGCEDKDQFTAVFINESPNEIVEITIRQTLYYEGESKPIFVSTRLKQLRPGEVYKEVCEFSSNHKYEIADERIIDEVTEEDVYGQKYNMY